MAKTENLLHRIDALQAETGIPRTIFAACPNSPAVIRASLRAAKRNNAPIYFAATLNQVDCDGGYTGMTQEDFTRLVRFETERVHFTGPVIVAIDHGGPWLKDRQRTEKWSTEDAMNGVKKSFEAAVLAGYDLIHVDPTVDINVPKGEIIDIHVVAARTVELIAHTDDRIDIPIHIGDPAYDKELGINRIVLLRVALVPCIFKRNILQLIASFRPEQHHVVKVCRRFRLRIRMDRFILELSILIFFRTQRRDRRRRKKIEAVNAPAEILIPSVDLHQQRLIIITIEKSPGIQLPFEIPCRLIIGRFHRIHVLSLVFAPVFPSFHNLFPEQQDEYGYYSRQKQRSYTKHTQDHSLYIKELRSVSDQYPYRPDHA